MVKEWKKLISTAHATTRIAHINADLIREIIPNANAKTIIRGRWSISELSDTNPPKKVLMLEIKEASE